MTLPEQLPMPADHDAERSALGACLLVESAVDDARAIVSPREFDHPSHAVIFEAICAVRDSRLGVDLVTVKFELNRRERLNTIGGVDYLNELVDVTPTTAHLEDHCRIIRDLYSRRETIKAARKIEADGFGPISTGAYLESANRCIANATDITDDHEPVAFHAVAMESFERIEKTVNSGKRISGTETGFRDLDSLIAGMHDGQLIIIAGRPAMGKTSFVTDIASYVALANGKRPVLFFSLEMPRIELGNRMLAGAARVDQGRLRSNMLTQEDMTALTGAASKLFNIPLYIDDSGDTTLLRVRSKARKFKSKDPNKDLALIVIDYLQLMKASRESDNREREISEISRGLKSLAKELSVPIIALSQLNRSPETRAGKNSKRPQLSDLRESGAIEQDADVVMFVYRDEVYNRDTEDKGIAEIIVAKQRNGPTDTVRLRFIRELTKFENLAEDDRGFAAPDANYQDGDAA